MPCPHQSFDPALLEKLHALHPHGAPVDWSALPGNLEPFPPSADLPWDDLVRSAILHFPRSSAAGPSGLRPGHLQDCIRRPGRGAGLVSALSNLARLWIEGKLPPDHAPAWCGATLIPLMKKDNGVRPVAIGDTLRRLVGKVLLSSPLAREQVGTLRPGQVGVGVRNATEAVAMGMQALACKLGDASPWV